MLEHQKVPTLSNLCFYFPLKLSKKSEKTIEVERTRIEIWSGLSIEKDLFFKEVYHYLNLSSISCRVSADHDYDNPPESSNSENGMCSDEEEDEEEDEHSSDEGGSDDSSSIGNLKYQQVTQVSQWDWDVTANRWDCWDDFWAERIWKVQQKNSL